MARKSKSLTEQIYDQLKDDIINVRLKEGQFLTESELAQRFKVSKTPVREALGRLNSEGFVETIPNKGYIITGISIRDLQNLFQVRSILEAAAVELAAANATKENLEELENLAKITFPLIDEASYLRFTELNFRFHVLLVASSQNPLLQEITTKLMNQLRRVLLIDLKKISIEEMSEKHLEIVKAIKNKEGKLAGKLIKEHIEKTKQRLFQH